MSSPHPLKRLVQSLAWALAFLLIFQLSFGLVAQTARLALSLTGDALSPEVKTALLFVGALAGLALGFLASFCLVPLAICQITSARRFKLPGGAPHLARRMSAWLIPGTDRPGNAFVAGIRLPRAWVARLPRPVRRWTGASVFFTERLLQELSPDELQAVMLHEMSHVELSHLPKRLGLGIVSVVASAAALGLFFFFILAVHAQTGSVLNPATLLLAAALGVGIQALVFRRWIRKQELEADQHAVRALGADPQALVSALQKLHLHAGPKRERTAASRLWDTHPSLDERKRSIHARSEAEKNRKKAA